MLTAEQPEEAEYSRQRNSDGEDGLHSAGTLAGTRILARELDIHDKQANLAGPANWHDTPGEYFECTRKLTATKAIKTSNSMAYTC
jgi:hypothetical protein